MRYVNDHRIDDLFSELIEKLHEARSTKPRRFIVDYLTALGLEPIEDKDVATERLKKAKVEVQDSGIDLPLIDVSTMESSLKIDVGSEPEIIDLTSCPSPTEMTHLDFMKDIEMTLKDIDASILGFGQTDDKK